MSDDGQGGEGVHIGAIPEVVIIVEVRVQDKTHRRAGPLTDLHNVFAGCRRQETRINDQDLTFANDDGCVASALAGVLDGVDALGQLCNLALLSRKGCGGQQRSNEKPDDESLPFHKPGRESWHCSGCAHLLAVNETIRLIFAELAASRRSVARIGSEYGR